MYIRCQFGHMEIKVHNNISIRFLRAFSLRILGCKDPTVTSTPCRNTRYQKLYYNEIYKNYIFLYLNSTDMLQKMSQLPIKSI